MSVEVRGIAVSAPSLGPAIGPAISGPAFGPSFSFVNEGPAPIGSFEGFSPLMPAAPDLGGTFGPVEALNSAFPIAEPQPMANILNEGPVGLTFLENTRPLGVEDFSYSPRAGIGVMVNPFLEPIIDSSAAFDHFDTLNDVTSDIASDVVLPFRHIYSDPISETRPLRWIMPGFLEPVPQEIKIGIAQPLVEEEEGAQIQIEQVREKIKSLSSKTNQAPRAYSAVRVEPAIQPQQAVQLEKIVYKKVEEGQEEKVDPGEKKSIELSQRRMIKDLKALAKRLSDARIAIMRAFDQVKPDKRTDKKVVGGEDVEKYIPQEYDGVRGKALKEDVSDSVPDGTYVLGRVAIREIRETDSPDEMQSKVDQAWNENYAVERSKGEQGEAASQKQVEDSYRYVNGKPSLRQTFVRMVKEREAQVAQDKSGDNVKTLEVPAEIVDSSKELAGEQRIEDNPQLAELFKIAA